MIYKIVCVATTILFAPGFIFQISEFIMCSVDPTSNNINLNNGACPGSFLFSYINMALIVLILVTSLVCIRLANKAIAVGELIEMFQETLNRKKILTDFETFMGIISENVKSFPIPSSQMESAKTALGFYFEKHAYVQEKGVV
jgi:hypothetical protein